MNSFVQLLKKDHQEKKSRIGNINIEGSINHMNRDHVENNIRNGKDFDNNHDHADYKNNNFKIRLSLSPGKNYNSESN